MTRNLPEITEFLSSPSHGDDCDSVFDQELSQIYFDDCGSSTLKHEFECTPTFTSRPPPSTVTTEPVEEESKLMLSTNIHDNKSTRLINRNSDTRSSFRETKTIIREIEVGTSMKWSRDDPDEYMESNQSPRAQSPDLTEPIIEEPESPRAQSPVLDEPMIEEESPVEPEPYLADTHDSRDNFPNRSFNEKRSNPFTEYHNKHSGPTRRRQKRCFSMPFVSTMPPARAFPREMRRFSAPHTTTETMRAMQNKVAAESRMNLLSQTMMFSQVSQKCLQEWDRKMGLSKAHSRTMIKSEKSRKKLQDMNLR